MAVSVPKRRRKIKELNKKEAVGDLLDAFKEVREQRERRMRREKGRVWVWNSGDSAAKMKCPMVPGEPRGTRGGKSATCRQQSQSRA